MPSSHPVIEVNGLGKKFCRNLKKSMVYGMSDLCRSFLSFKIDTQDLREAEFWALEDVSFQLGQGESLGLIGMNGSGKSTLLRLLTGIFPPDKGDITIRGRVGALIALGAGFHPHMTGRENVFLNGTILGMSHGEIKKKYDEIVEFSGIADFMEAPVVTYSSGMLVRLGFSVAAHIEPEVLLIDEVLAVGDLSFRNRCVEKIGNLRKNTTVVFVSHDMNQVSRICHRAILLDKGNIVSAGHVDEVLVEYSNLTLKKEKESLDDVIIYGDSKDILGLKIYTTNNKNEEKSFFNTGDDIHIHFEFSCEQDIKDVLFGNQFWSTTGMVISGANNLNTRIDQVFSGKNHLIQKIKSNRFLEGNYNLRFKWKRKDNSILLDGFKHLFSIESDSHNRFRSYGVVKMDFEWILQ